jgi:hypothetical protein
MAAKLSSVRSESVRFLEADGNAAGGNAGTWAASFEIPVGAVLIDILVSNNVAWTATTSATLTVGDANDDDGYFAAVDCKMAALQGLSLAFPLAKQGAYVTPNIATSVGIIRRQMQPAVAGAVSGRIMKCAIVTVGVPVAPRPGDTTVTFVYAYPDVMKPVFTTA